MRPKRALYVLRDHYRLTVRSKALAISVKNGEQFNVIATVPIRSLDSLVLIGSGSLSTYALALCASKGVRLSLIGRNGQIIAALNPELGHDLWTKQLSLAMDPELSTDIARKICRLKIQSQIGMLNLWKRKTKEVTLLIQLSLTSLLGSLDDKPGNLLSIRGIEGAAAKIYFEALRSQISSDRQEFHSAFRSRRPPRDRLNCMLSFSYSLLRSEVSAATRLVGLLPHFGFLHSGAAKSKPNLVLDLMEELRAPLADRLVLRLVNRRQLHPHDHFEACGNAIHLNNIGKRILIEEFERTLSKVRACQGDKSKRITGRESIILGVDRFARFIAEGKPMALDDNLSFYN